MFVTPRLLGFEIWNAFVTSRLLDKNYFYQLTLLFNLFLLLFLDFIVLFDIIHRSHCTILTNFYFHL